MLTFTLKPKALRRIVSGSVWLWPTDLETPESLPVEATEVLLVEPRGRPVASALWDSSSPVPIRVYARRKQEFNEAFVAERWSAAVAWRQQVVAPDSTGYRVVHSEGDRMPGLIVDRFSGHYSIAISMTSWRRFLPFLADRLAAGGTMPTIGVESKDGTEFWGVAPASFVSYRVNGLTYFAPTAGGQKTGAFLDQRENYRALMGWIARLGTRKHGLDLYTSNGGFARHMAKEQEKVDAVDSSRAALELLEMGLKADEEPRIRMLERDVREYLVQHTRDRSQSDVVVVDPPAFAKSKGQRQGAARQYFDINEKAMRVTPKGALFVSCSCSHHMGNVEFEEIIRESAAQNEKTLQLLERRSQGPDHPILTNLPETEYLKCLIFRVL